MSRARMDSFNYSIDMEDMIHDMSSDHGRAELYRHGVVGTGPDDISLDESSDIAQGSRDPESLAMLGCGTQGTESFKIPQIPAHATSIRSSDSSKRSSTTDWGIRGKGHYDQRLSNTTPSSNPTQETVLTRILRGGPLKNPIFPDQINILRKVFDPGRMVSLPEQIELADHIGLPDFEVSYWLETEDRLHRYWDSLEVAPRRNNGSHLDKLSNKPKSFLRQIWMLRELFSYCQYPEEDRVQSFALKADLRVSEVDSWFDKEREIYFLCTMNVFPKVHTTTPVSMFGSSSSSSNISSPWDLMSSSSGQNFSQSDSLPTGSNSDSDPSMSWWPSTQKLVGPRKRTQSTIGFAVETLQLPPHKKAKTRCALGPYPCLTCPVTSTDLHRWREHQKRTHFPTKSWRCTSVATDGRLCHYGPVFERTDNALTHLRIEHNILDPQEAKQLIVVHALPITDIFHDRCGFCSANLSNFDQSMSHIVQHLRNGKTAEEWNHQCEQNHEDVLARRKRRDTYDDFHDGYFEGPDASGGGDNGSASDDHDGQDFGTSTQAKSGNAQSKGQPSSHGFDLQSGQTRRAAVVNCFGDVPVDSCLLDYREDSDSPELQVLSPSILSTPLNLSVLRTERFLGRGLYGFVEKVVSPSNSRILIRKTILLQNLELNQNIEPNQLEEELESLKNLHHAHLTTFVGYYSIPSAICLVSTPLADLNLSQYLQQPDLARQDQQYHYTKRYLTWMNCLRSAVAYLHASGIVHGDIKPNNILLVDTRIMLTDFGHLKRYMSHEAIELVALTTVTDYVAPETVNHGLLDSSADIFSLGCVYSEILTKASSKTITDYEQFRSVDLNDTAYWSTRKRAVQWMQALGEEHRRKEPHYTQVLDAFHITCTMLKKCPEARPAADGIVFPDLICSYSAVPDNQEIQQASGEQCGTPSSSVISEALQCAPNLQTSNISNESGLSLLDDDHSGEDFKRMTQDDEDLPSRVPQNQRVQSQCLGPRFSAPPESAETDYTSCDKHLGCGRRVVPEASIKQPTCSIEAETFIQQQFDSPDFENISCSPSILSSEMCLSSRSSEFSSESTDLYAINLMKPFTDLHTAKNSPWGSPRVQYSYSQSASVFEPKKSRKHHGYEYTSDSLLTSVLQNDPPLCMYPSSASITQEQADPKLIVPVLSLCEPEPTPELFTRLEPPAEAFNKLGSVPDLQLRWTMYYEMEISGDEPYFWVLKTEYSPSEDFPTRVRVEVILDNKSRYNLYPCIYPNCKEKAFRHVCDLKMHHHDKHTPVLMDIFSALHGYGNYPFWNSTAPENQMLVHYGDEHAKGHFSMCEIRTKEQHTSSGSKALLGGSASTNSSDQISKPRVPKNNTEAIKITPSSHSWHSGDLSSVNDNQFSHTHGAGYNEMGDFDAWPFPGFDGGVQPID